LRAHAPAPLLHCKKDHLVFLRKSGEGKPLPLYNKIPNKILQNEEYQAKKGRRIKEKDNHYRRKEPNEAGYKIRH
jgi:hypothetical protein